MFHIVMDTAGDMPNDWAETFAINVIPVYIQFGNRTYAQGVDIKDDDFYRMADSSDVIPKTSQPTPQHFIEFYERIAKIGETILSLHVTSKLSGTFQSAEIAAKELAGKFNIIPFDSWSGSAALGYMCREARLLERAGNSLQAILERMDFIRRNVHIVLTVDSLEYAYKSGRVNAIQTALASILKVKPVIVLREGVLDMADKVRTRGRALDHLLEAMRLRMGDRLVNAAVVHARDPQTGASLMERVKQVLNCKELVMTNLSIGVAANLGPGTVGIVAYPVEER